MFEDYNNTLELLLIALCDLEKCIKAIKVERLPFNQHYLRLKIVDLRVDCIRQQQKLNMCHNNAVKYIQSKDTKSWDIIQASKEIERLVLKYNKGVPPYSRRISDLIPS